QRGPPGLVLPAAARAAAGDGRARLRVLRGLRCSVARLRRPRGAGRAARSAPGGGALGPVRCRPGAEAGGARAAAAHFTAFSTLTLSPVPATSRPAPRCGSAVVVSGPVGAMLGAVAGLAMLALAAAPVLA